MHQPIKNLPTSTYLGVFFTFFLGSFSNASANMPGWKIISFWSISFSLPLLIFLTHSSKYFTCCCSAAKSFKNGVKRIQTNLCISRLKTYQLRHIWGFFYFLFRLIFQCFIKYAWLENHFFLVHFFFFAFTDFPYTFK